MAKRRKRRLSGWRDKSASWLSTIALAGLGLVVLQGAATKQHLAGLPSRRRRPRQGISILKPLCGVEDGLEESLRLYAGIPYAPFEMLLGVESTEDPAWELAGRVERQWPHVRRILREGTPGYGPKVNQLITLERYAQYPIFLISDANTRPPLGYLDEISALFEDPAVGIVAHPFTGKQHQTMGAMIDTLHCANNPHLAAASLLDEHYVIGGSEAIRRDVLAQLGGFMRYKDTLNDDYVSGRDVKQLGYKIAMARLPVENVTPTRTVDSFFKRFERWGQGQATAYENSAPAVAMGLLNPIPLAALAWCIAPAGAPAQAALKTLGLVTAGKIAVDMSNAKAAGVNPLGATEALSVPVKDTILFGSWASGLLKREVEWRGKKFRAVGPGTHLEPL